MFISKKIAATTLFVCLSLLTLAQYSICGKITNQKGEPIAGATIQIDNTYIACQSKSEGNYSLKNLKSESIILQVSSFGYLPTSDTLSLTDTTIQNIQLVESSILLDEVIVSSTRIDERTAMAFSNLNKEEISKQNIGQDCNNIYL